MVYKLKHHLLCQIEILLINGGFILVDAAGDGLDANGSITMTGGTAIVNGPENNGNGALDYDGSFDMQGGTLIAAGSTGMAQAPSISSAQASINVILPSAVSNTLVTVKNSAGEEVLSFMPTKSCQSIVISSPELVTGETYSVYYGGTASGTENGGLYTDGTADEGTLLTEFTLSSSVMTVSSLGATEGMGGGMMHGGGGRGQGGMQGGMQGENIPNMPGIEAQ